MARNLENMCFAYLLNKHVYRAYYGPGTILPVLQILAPHNYLLITNINPQNYPM